MKVEILEQVDAGWWNGLVHSNPQGTIYQTTQYAEFVRRYYRAQPSFIVAEENGAVAGQLVLFRMGRFPDRDAARPWRDHVKTPINRLLRVFRWYGGPLVFEPAERMNVLSAILDHVNLLARRQQVVRLEHGALPFDEGGSILPAVPKGFEQTEWGTFLIDLTQPNDVCWGRLKGNSARRSVRRAMKLGVRVTDATGAADLLAQCDLAHGAAYHLAAWPEAFWSTLRDALGPQGYHVLAAEHNGRLVAFAPFLVFGRTMHLLKPVQDPQCKADKVPAGDLLIWEAIRFGQRLGLAQFDLAGVSPVPTSEAERGIWFFGSKWGGAYVTYPILRKRYRAWLM
jgi:hypothetical protein